jgi:hypothetical protein
VRVPAAGRSSSFCRPTTSTRAGSGFDVIDSRA